MKIILTVPMAIFLGSWLGSCSGHDNQSNSVSASKDSISEGLPTIPYDEMLGRVAGLSGQAGIGNLKDAKLPDDQREIRIWKGFGLTYPRCFILRIENGNASASFVSPKVIGAKAVFDKGNPVYATKVLNAPHSGWVDLVTYLREQGIDSSIELSLDKHFIPDPDGEELVLEMRNASYHTMAYYNDSTVTGDGKKAFGICQKIEKEFDIHLGCHDERRPTKPCS